MYLQDVLGNDSKFGIKAGSYVKLCINNIPIEFRNCFDYSKYVILGGISSNQATSSTIKSRVSLHALQKKPLKTNVPSLLSFGWHRIQSAATFCSQAVDLSLRYLKYTPQVSTCIAAFAGPSYPQKTGISLYTMNENVFYNSFLVIVKIFHLF